jgi:hypothetical protein
MRTDRLILLATVRLATKRLSIGLAAIALATVTVALLPAKAQAHADCPVRPQTLAQMRDCYRPLLVFAPTATDPRLATQRKLLDAAADDMMDRNVLLIPVVDPASSFEAPLDAPYMLLGAAEMAAARRRFGIAPGAFRVLLLGEDGGEKLRGSGPVSPDRLNSLIDRMPMRRLEMQRPHAN